MTDSQTLLLFIVGCLIGLSFYFLPAIVAKSREHPNSLSIFVFNFFLGWTFLGWVIALVWACSNPRRGTSDVTVVVHQNPWNHGQAPPLTQPGSLVIDASPSNEPTILVSRQTQQKRGSGGAWFLLALGGVMVVVAIFITLSRDSSKTVNMPTATTQPRDSAFSSPEEVRTSSPDNGAGDVMADSNADPHSARNPDESLTSGEIQPPDSTLHKINAIAQGYGASNKAIVCADASSLAAMYQSFEGTSRPALLPGCLLLATGTKLSMQTGTDGVHVYVVLPDGKLLIGMTMREMVASLDPLPASEPVSQ